MPQIHLKQPGQPVADFSVAANIVTVAGVVIDCVERQLDTSVTVEIRANETGPSEGGNGAYLAQIEIPARRLVDVRVTGEDGQDQTTQEPVALDPNAITVTLWPAA